MTDGKCSDRKDAYYYKDISFKYPGWIEKKH
jgi:hypothetical protein